MLPKPLAAVVIVLAMPLRAAQSPAPASVPTPADSPEPQLIASQKVSPPLGKCEKRRFAWAQMAVDFSSEGVPQGIGSFELSRPEAKELVLQTLREDRLVLPPQERKELTVHQGLMIEMSACVDKVVSADGKKSEQLWLDAPPKQTLYTLAPHAKATGTEKIGGHVSAPVAINSPAASMTKQAQDEGIQGDVRVWLIVDDKGMPQNLRIIKPLPAGLNESALDTVSHYRFKPAMKDGKTPVPCILVIAVNFRHY